MIVRGCKVHNTMAPYADELIVLPTRVMGPEEKDYAIAFAIPADTEGVYLIGREAFSLRSATRISTRPSPPRAISRA